MKHLWSPWRMAYIKAFKKTEGCVFCSALEQEDGPENLIVQRGEFSFVILNRYPYSSGHLMVLPYEHVQRLEELNAPTRAEMIELVSQCTQVLGQIYKAEGFNIGANIGAAAGAGIEEHVHLHIVPRWVGDTNFISTIGETRVLPEALEDTFQQVKERWQR
ncbi:HIT domain-containing protein [Chloroflexota bacterium]